MVAPSAYLDSDSMLAKTARQPQLSAASNSTPMEIACFATVLSSNLFLENAPSSAVCRLRKVFAKAAILHWDSNSTTVVVKSPTASTSRRKVASSVVTDWQLEAGVANRQSKKYA